MAHKRWCRLETFYGRSWQDPARSEAKCVLDCWGGEDNVHHSMPLEFVSLRFSLPGHRTSNLVVRTTIERVELLKSELIGIVPVLLLGDGGCSGGGCGL